MATRKDVARIANVSVATVSYVLNGTKRVTPQVERRVREAAEALHYHPNLLARGLTTRRSRHIALVIDSPHNPHYNEILAGVQLEAAEQDYIVTSLIAVPGPEEIASGLEGRGIDGVILAMTKGNAAIAAQLDHTYCTVCMGDQLTVDYLPAMRDMIGKLTALGHRRFAFLSGIPLDPAENTRFTAWRQALWEAGITPEEALTVAGDSDGPDAFEGERETRQLLSRGVPFTALFAINDLMAMGAMRTLYESGLNVPRDVSVVGCDCLKVFRTVTPTPASLDVHSEETGRQLARRLIERIAGRESPPDQLRAEFIPGETVGRANETRIKTGGSEA